MQLTLANPTVGEVLRPFELKSAAGHVFQSQVLTGKIAVLFFYGHEEAPASAGMVLAFNASLAPFESRGVAVVGIGITTSDKQKAFVEQQRLRVLLLADPQFQVSALHGVLQPKQASPIARVEAGTSENVQLAVNLRTILVGPDHRIVKIYENPDPSSHLAEVIKDIDALLLPEPPRRMFHHAPVLLIPNVLPKGMCEELIRIWHEDGNDDSGFMKQVDGKTVGMYDYSYKKRRDHFMKPSPQLKALRELIKSRVLPAMRTAFNYEATRFEDFRIARYDAAAGGYFRPHRDNTTDGTAHRRFAMSLLLNDDYEGGCLRFPEYGLHEYRPRAGGAVIFSCSLLHEATDVTAGLRFVLLSFLYGEKEAKLREEYNLRTGGQYRAGPP